MSEQLRKAILDSGRTGRDLSQASRVAESIVSRFLRGETELREGNLDKLCAALGLVLTKKPGKSRKGG